jgi:DNA phosphorothioation-dependent restriction protein DptG
MTQTEILTLVMKAMTSSKPRYGGVFELQESMIIDLVNMAIEQEREACAKLMETHKNLPDAGMGYGAALIRARSEK